MKEYIDGKNIIREIYELPNGKIYLKIDTDILQNPEHEERQLHIQLDETALLKLTEEIHRLLTIKGLKEYLKI